MSGCNTDDVLYVRAGDAWALTFTYSDDGVPQPLPDGAKLDVRSDDGVLLLTASIGTGLEFTDDVGVIEMLIEGSDTLPLAVDGKRTELTLALKVFDTLDPDATSETIEVREVVAQPQMVTP